MVTLKKQVRYVGGKTGCILTIAICIGVLLGVIGGFALLVWTSNLQLVENEQTCRAKFRDLTIQDGNPTTEQVMDGLDDTYSVGRVVPANRVGWVCFDSGARITCKTQSCIYGWATRRKGGAEFVCSGTGDVLAYCGNGTSTISPCSEAP